MQEAQWAALAGTLRALERLARAPGAGVDVRGAALATAVEDIALRPMAALAPLLPLHGRWRTEDGERTITKLLRAERRVGMALEPLASYMREKLDDDGEPSTTLRGLCCATLGAMAVVAQRGDFLVDAALGVVADGVGGASALPISARAACTVNGCVAAFVQTCVAQAGLDQAEEGDRASKDETIFLSQPLCSSLGDPGGSEGDECGGQEPHALIAALATCAANARRGPRSPSTSRF